MTTTTGSDLDQLLATPAFFQDPHPVYHRLRAEDPVHWSDVNAGWMLTRYDDVLATVKDARHFSSRGCLTAALERLPADVRTHIQPLEDPIAIASVLNRMPNLRLASGDLRWHEHGLIRGLVSLPVTF